MMSAEQVIFMVLYLYASCYSLQDYIRPSKRARKKNSNRNQQQQQQRCAKCISHDEKDRNATGARLLDTDLLECVSSFYRVESRRFVFYTSSGSRSIRYCLLSVNFSCCCCIFYYRLAIFRSYKSFFYSLTFVLR